MTSRDNCLILTTDFRTLTRFQHRAGHQPSGGLFQNQRPAGSQNVGDDRNHLRFQRIKFRRVSSLSLSSHFLQKRSMRLVWYVACSFIQASVLAVAPETPSSDGVSKN